MSTDDLVEAFAAKVKACGVPLRSEDNTPRFRKFEERLPNRLPPSFASLLSAYSFPSFDVLGISLFGWESDSNPYIAEAAAPRGSLSELLLPKGYAQIGRPDTGNFDAVCFDLNQKTHNREYRIVQIDHEDILCNWKVRVLGELWPSFVKLMKSAVTISDPRVYWEERPEQLVGSTGKRSPPVFQPDLPVASPHSGTFDRSYKIIEDERVKALNPPKDWIVCEEGCGLSVNSSCGLQSIGCSQTMKRAHLCGQVGDLQIRGKPFDVRIGRQQSKKLVHALIVGITVRLNQQFRHGDRRGDRARRDTLDPRKNVIGERKIPWICFQLVYEDAGVQAHPLVALEEPAEPI